MNTPCSLAYPLIICVVWWVIYYSSLSVHSELVKIVELFA